MLLKTLMITVFLFVCTNLVFATNVIKEPAGTDITTELQTDLNTYKEVTIDGSLGSNVINTTINMPAGVKLNGINNATIVAATTITGTLSTNMRYFSFSSTTSNSQINYITFLPSSSGFSSLTTYSLSAIYIQGANNQIDHCTFTFSFAYGKDVYAVWIDGPSGLYNYITYNNCTTVGIQYAENGASFTYCASNYIKNAGTDALQGTGNNSSTPKIPCKGNIVTQNTVVGAGYIGVEDHLLIDGTVISYNHFLSSGKAGVVGTRMGISSVGTNTQVTGNDVTGFGDYGIEVTGAQGLLVNSNYVRDTTNSWVDIFMNSLTAMTANYINATTISDNDLVGGNEGIHQEGNFNVMLNVTGNKIKNTAFYGIYFSTDTINANVNILNNTFDYTIPNTKARNAIFTYTPNTTSNTGNVIIDKNIITYESTAAGGVSSDVGIIPAHAGTLISNNVVNTNNITNAGSSPIYAYATNAIAVDGVKYRDNKINGAGNVDLSSFTNTIQTGNNWPGGNKSGGIVAANDLTSLTAASSSVATFTNSGLAGTFRIASYLNIKTITTDVLQMQVTYTDENSNSRTAIFYPQGKTVAGLSTVGDSSFPPVEIRCKASTSITVTTSFTTSGGSINYDCGATITQLR